MHRNFLFDLDQTLLDFHATERLALQLVLKENGLPFSEAVYQDFRACNKALWLQLEKGEISRTELFRRRFDHVFRRCGAEGTDPLAVNDAFVRTMSRNGIPMEGAIDFLRRLREGVPGARICVITNGVTVNAKGRIASTGLDRYLDGVFISEELGVAKPDRAYFDRCLREIGAAPEDCIVIGDSLTSDMLGAQNAGLCSVWFRPEGDAAEAVRKYDIDFCAASFDELYTVLADWAARC